MTKQGRDASVFTLTVLTAAIGAGSASEANAQSYSTAPSGYVPIVFSTAMPKTVGFDIDKSNGIDFNIISSSSSISLAPLRSTVSYSGFLGQLTRYDSVDSFQPVTDLKSNSANNLGNGNFASLDATNNYSNFSAGVPQFAEVGINLAYDANGNITGGQRGYFNVTRTTIATGGTNSGGIETFTVNDYGLLGVAAAAPEPSTWLLLTLGFGAVGGAMRRRRRAADRGLALAA